MVEIDEETGEPAITKYVAVDDCGNVINPLLVEGQVHGGLVQGIGQALYEEVVYDENGQRIPVDMESLYGVTDADEVVACQAYTFDPLLRRLRDFVPGGQAISPQPQPR